ncbi:radical SAM/SPASM domain-containing protein [Streptomyces sp. NPDC002537]
MTALVERPITHPVQLTTLELEITGGCQLTCTHCLASSSPQGTHGTMTFADWHTVVGDAAVLNIPHVQLIGGEPTLYPRWVELVEHTLDLGIGVEVYSNLFHVRPQWWEVFGRSGVTLATSCYSDDPAEHDAITTRAGSHRRTRDNIAEAVQRGIPIRVGIVEVLDGQRVEQAHAELTAMGVQRISTDRVRAVGRAAGREAAPTVDELCGRCGQGKAAVLPDGSLALCVMSRFMPCGNVREARLTDLVGSEQWWQAVGLVPAPGAGGCAPDDSACQPGQTACLPKFPNIPQDGPR